MELHEAIKEVCSKRGADIIKTPVFFNMLADYQAFVHYLVCKNVLKTILSQDFGMRLYAEFLKKESFWQNICQQFSYEIVQANGFQKEIVAYILNCIAYGIGWSEEIPVLNQLMESPSQMSVGVRPVREMKIDEGKFICNFDEESSCNEIDPFLIDAAKIVVQTQYGSPSLIQRRMRLGYNRAGRIMDQLEEFGIVGPASGLKPRSVLVKDDMQLRNLLLQKGLL